MRHVPNVPGATLNADAFMADNELVGFFIAEQPRTVALHLHDFFEFAIVTQGTGTHHSGERRHPVRRGTAILIPPGALHGYELGEDLVVYNCFVRPEATEYDLPWIRRDAFLGRLFSGSDRMLIEGNAGRSEPVIVLLDEPDLVTCLGHFDAIRTRPAAERSEAYDLGHLLLALDVLGRRVRAERPDLRSIDPRAPTIVITALELIESDLQRHWGLAELAAVVCVGQFHLARTFRRWVGQSTGAFANRRRAERAALLLTTTDDPVASIGAQVGWEDPAYFARRFRRATGVSPRVYRVRARAHQAGQRPTHEGAIAV
ncbi:MAG: helix-turn-helix domain-containing protein [Candidatus Limnocylindrales bacterium]